MKMDDFILVSVDDHLVEPPDMFERHICDKYTAQMPKVSTNIHQDIGRNPLQP